MSDRFNVDRASTMQMLYCREYALIVLPRLVLVTLAAWVFSSTRGLGELKLQDDEIDSSPYHCYYGSFQVQGRMEI